MKTIRAIIYLFVAFYAININAQLAKTTIIPEPLKVNVSEGKFVLSPHHSICVDKKFEEAQNELSLLQQVIEQRIESKLKITRKDKNSAIFVKYDKGIKSKEGYSLNINASGIYINAFTQAGLFYAIQTLDQLFPEPIESKIPGELAHVSIEDSPRFEYRALMLDPARHYFPLDDIKNYIDVMASYKFNTLHLHLTDDHGWRVEIKKYPLLTEIGSKRKETMGDGRPHEGFYSQVELKELVKYAKTKHVEIIPEIDMPGHGMAILAAYPDLACFPKDFEVSTVPGVSKELLCSGKEEVYQFYEDVLTEIAGIFPNAKMHLGGDEAPLDRWEKCPHCQKVLSDKGMAHEDELMAYFFERINKVLIKLGKDPLLWYESNVKTYPKNSYAILWRNEDPDDKMCEIQKRGLKMINAYGRNAYFDYPQWEGDIPKTTWMPILSLEKAYDFDPVRGLSEEESYFIIGVQACLWAEYLPNIDRVFYMTYPRALALSEAGWSSDKNRSWEKFKRKLNKHILRFANKGINMRFPFELKK
ncbi:MAG: beta-N-acetylhexosaminidase [Carboxylicivirga sp.]|jgi:hexosaminidase|nr:beta-N-acetylhexosaminidase [Carboxylicivirga sp.]